MKIRAICLIAGIASFEALSGIRAPACAQDSHYWTYTYGTRASMLSNAVIGGVVDLSATYYNPGRLSLFETSDVLMATKVFHYRVTQLQNVAGSGADLRSSQLNTAPGIVAGMFKLEWHGNHRVGYSILTRQDANLNLKGTEAAPGSSSEATPGIGHDAIDFRLTQNLFETWWGVSWSYKAGANLGVGVTQYLTVRFQSAELLTIGERLDAERGLATTILGRKYDFCNYRTLWKAGLALHRGSWNLGLVATTPGFLIFGEGSTGVNVSSTGRDIDDDGEPDTIMAVDYRKKLRADYRTPFSLGAGAEYTSGNTSLYLSAEWFAAVGRYEVLSTNGFRAQTSDSLFPNEVTNALEAVFNVGFGAERAFTERFQGYLSFSTDFSAKAPDGDTNLSITDWDIYHIAGGAAADIGRASFTLGLGYSWSGRKNLGSYGPATGEESSRIAQSMNELSYRCYKFFFSFSF